MKIQYINTQNKVITIGTLIKVDKYTLRLIVRLYNSARLVL